MNPHGGAIAVGFVQLLASMLSGLLIDTVGRIPLLIISSVFMSLALASFGSYAYYDQENKMLGGDTDWIPLLCVLVFTIAFSLGEWNGGQGGGAFLCAAVDTSSGSSPYRRICCAPHREMCIFPGL